MTRMLILVVVVSALVGGGTYYIMHRSEIAVSAPATASPAQSPQNTVVIERKSDDEALKQKRLAGIGSVKKLKPVELGPTVEQEARANKH